MNKEEIEKYLGKYVEIKLFDGTIHKGEFHKTGEKEYKNNPNLYLPKNYYFVDKPHDYCVFRSSHIRKIKHLSCIMINEKYILKGNDDE